VADLYQFLNEWFFFLPTTHDGLDRIAAFSFLFYKNEYGKKFILEEPGRSWSLRFAEERGKYMDSPESTANLDVWLSDDSLGNSDFVSPPEGFKSFNEFFTRELKPGARRVDDVGNDSIVSSPADGVVNMIANDLRLDSEIPTKGAMTLSLSRLLDHSEYSEKFVGGTALAVFLMPDNYHHYHSPVSGVVVESKENVGDRLFGMPDMLDMVNKGNPGYGKDYSVLQNFRHGYFIIETADFGFVAMVPIGLQTVGSVVFEEEFRSVRPDSTRQVHRGEKMGHFAYGGSTVLVMFEPGRMAAVSVQQGQRIGRMRE
jgi:phosphatidylserine decarboxylase